MKPRSILPRLRTRGALALFAVLLGASLAGLGLPGAAQAQTAVGVEFDGLNGTGPFLVASHPATGFVCTATVVDADLGAPAMPLGWDNRVSSYLTGAACWAEHYDGANFTGVFVGPLPGPLNLGPLDNLTSSIIWT